MSWFKKIFGSQYDFSSQSSSQNSSQEPRVHYVKQKDETDSSNTDIENLTISEVEYCDDTQDSMQDSTYSWATLVKKLTLDEKKDK